MMQPDLMACACPPAPFLIKGWAHRLSGEQRARDMYRYMRMKVFK